MEMIIRFEHVTKRYYLGSHRAHTRYLLPEFMQNFIDNRRLKHDHHQARSGILNALRDVSFEIQPGEALGLIGPNGAGKTTTMSLLAGITAPTEGRVTVHGRVSALIQLGAGFHPELTGRENIYLNGTIMGLKKKKIDSILESIIAFSELESFIDTPIKRYSSGMQVRLGFAVAVHTEPEILLIDEVLAVGDAGFKTKCYQKIRELKDIGTTVVLVSHDLSQIKNLSDRAILLTKGMVVKAGEVDSVIDAYYQAVFGAGSPMQTNTNQGENSTGKRLEVIGSAQITEVKFLNETGEATDKFKTGDAFTISISYLAKDRIEKPAFGIAIHTADGITLIGVNTKIDNYPIETLQGVGRMEFTIPELSLLPGTYLVSVGLHDKYMGFYDRKSLAFTFQVVSGPTTSGLVLPPHEWKLSIP
jgi:ABC-type polysaccharide/polyol phosphate transport system ATPase subunit